MTKKFVREKPGKRSGTIRWIQFPPRLDAAIVAEMDAVAAVDRRKPDYQGIVKRMCLDWIEGRTSDHPVTVPAEDVVRLGRPPKGRPKKARLNTSTTPSTRAIAGAQKPTDERNGTPITK
jgi:hypothetical protein